MPALKNLVITATGNCGHEPSRLKKWVEANGGRWVPRVLQGVTHVICSKDHYKRGVDAVKQAKELNAFIVSYDWLEDSLQKKRKLAERKYTWEVLRNQRKKEKEIKRLGLQADTKFNKGCEMALQDTGSGASRTVSTPSRPRPSQSRFFVPAMEDLRQRREARAAEEEARKKAKDVATMAHVVCSAQSCPSDQSAQDDNPPSSPQDQTSKSPVSQPDPNFEDKQTAPPSETINPKSTSAAQKPSSQRSQSSPSKTGGHQDPQNVPQAKLPKLTDLYHIWLDNTGFEYNLKLVRSNLYLNNHASYVLRIYESHTKPHTYCTYVQYVPPLEYNTIGKVAVVPGQKTSRGIASIKQEQEQVQKEATTSTSSCLNSFQENSTMHTEATRLNSLVQHPLPSPDHPHREVVCPLNSTFANAFRAFRHVFRDLTLLSWEQRFDDAYHSQQKTQAKVYRIEPYIWIKPEKGMPIGIIPALPLSPRGTGTRSGRAGEEGNGDEQHYTRNAFNLPGISTPLGKQGVIGSAIHRDEEARRKKEQEAARLAAEVEDAKTRKTKAKSRVRTAGAKSNVNANGGLRNNFLGVKKEQQEKKVNRSLLSAVGAGVGSGRRVRVIRDIE